MDEEKADAAAAAAKVTINTSFSSMKNLVLNPGTTTAGPGAIFGEMALFPDVLREVTRFQKAAGLECDRDG